MAYAMVFQFNWLRFLKSTEGMLSASHLDRYHRIVKYIQEHSGERISLSDIVASEYITKTYFSQFWKKFSSYSFTQRVNYERILKSEFLLLKGENILKISEQCGFSDVKYYYQNFRKWYGCLPSEHRKRCQDYTERGADYEEIGALRCKREFQSYWERVLFSEHNPEGEGNKPDSLQGFMKLKDPTSSSCVNVHSTTILMLNPFKSDVLHLDDMGKIVFQWDTLDSLVKMSTDTGTHISVGIFTDCVEPLLLLEGIQHFLEESAIRYGKGKMKLWRYQLYYENPILFDKSISIEKLIAERIKGAIIHHYFQI